MLYKGSLNTWHSGGVSIKLKVGKGEDKPAEDEEEITDPSTNEEEKPETKEETSEEKQDVESLRKVIKINQADESAEKKEEKPTETEPTGRESLEQKRAILQNIKDFDFQIKKNQEEISGVNKKLDGMSKDLDDLVSLYEIVSEQMNPFVGLSKVTKKRLDALENFTREIEALKDRTGELESFAEKSGAKIQSLGEGRQQVKAIDTDAIIAQMDGKTEGEKIGDKESEQKETVENKDGKAEVKGSEDDADTEETEEKVEETKEPKDSTAEEILKEEKEIQISPITEESEDMFSDDFFTNIPVEDTFNTVPVHLIDTSIELTDDSFDMDLDMIFEMAFGLLNESLENKIDIILDDFIESLKG